jgi:hypothetical protein
LDAPKSDALVSQRKGVAVYGDGEGGFEDHVRDSKFHILIMLFAASIASSTASCARSVAVVALAHFILGQ